MKVLFLTLVALVLGGCSGETEADDEMASAKADRGSQVATKVERPRLERGRTTSSPVAVGKTTTLGHWLVGVASKRSIGASCYVYIAAKNTSADTYSMASISARGYNKSGQEVSSGLVNFAHMAPGQVQRSAAIFLATACTQLHTFRVRLASAFRE